MLEKLKTVKVGPLPLAYYAPIFLLLVVAIYTGNLNADIVGTMAFLLMLGWALQFIGDRIPVLGKWCGFGTLLPLFGGSALATFHLIPQSLIEQTSTFMGSGFINVFLGAIIAGSILGMDRKLLLGSALKVIPCFLCALVGVFAFMAIGCVLTGQSLLDGIFMCGITSYAGGSSGSLAVIPAIYEPLFGEDAGAYAAKFLVFLNISNLICVVLASLLGKFGDAHPELACRGVLARGSEDAAQAGSAGEVMDMKKNIHRLGVGLVLSTSFLILGNVVAAVLPQLNYIAWATIIIIVFKAAGIMSDDMCASAGVWQQFIVRNFIAFLITGIGIASLNLGDLVGYLSVPNVLIILLGVLGSIVGSLVGGKLVGFYPIEAMIGIGCNMGNTGGSGALQVLSATDRMELMPFAVISNRLGGALVVIIISLVVPLLA